MIALWKKKKKINSLVNIAHVNVGPMHYQVRAPKVFCAL